jgi:hypothetical protein
MLKHLLATTAVVVALGGAAQAQQADETTEPLVEENAADEAGTATEGDATAAEEPPMTEEEGTTAAEEAPAAEEGTGTETTTIEVPVEEETTAEDAPAVEGEATTAEEAPAVETDDTMAEEAPAVEGEATTAEEAPAVETDDTMAAEPAEPLADPAAPVAGADPAAMPQLMPVEISELTVENLTGSDLRNPEGENLGTIDDALLAEDGSIRSLVVSFGGFLGFGKKTVEVPLDDVEFMRDEADNIIVETSMTPESLESMPEYQEESET